MTSYLYPVRTLYEPSLFFYSSLLQNVVNKEEGGVTINPMTPDVELEEPVQGLCCSMPKMASAEPDLSHIDDHERRGMVAKISRLWVNGTHITYTLLPELFIILFVSKNHCLGYLKTPARLG
jgi:hypothetical protein